MFKAKPNDLTKLAVEQPMRYAVLSGVAAAGLVSIALWTVGTAAALVGALVAFGLTFLLNLVLWRPGGRGRRWYERRSG